MFEQRMTELKCKPTSTKTVQLLETSTSLRCCRSAKERQRKEGKRHAPCSRTENVQTVPQCISRQDQPTDGQVQDPDRPWNNVQTVHIENSSCAEDSIRRAREKKIRYPVSSRRKWSHVYNKRKQLQGMCIKNSNATSWALCKEKS